MEATSTSNKSKWGKPLILLFIAFFIGGNIWVTIRTYNDWYTAKNGTPVHLKVLNDKSVCRIKRKVVIIDYHGPYKIRLYGAKCRKAIYTEGQMASFRISKKGKIVAEENAYQTRITTAALLFLGGIVALILVAKKIR
jgi:hypothetical protein